MNELLVQFVIEARELLEEAGADLLALEQRTGNADTVNRLFRAIHTLKGSSGLFDVAPLTRVLHAAEDVFQSVRDGIVPLTPEFVDLALDVLDQTGRWVDHLERNETLPAEAAPIAATFQQALRAMLAGTPDTAKAADVAVAPATAGELPDALANVFGEQNLMTVVTAARNGQSVILISYTPEEGCLFKGEDPLHVMLQVPGLEALITVLRGDLPPENRDTYCSVLAFHAFALAPLDELNTLFRYVPDQVVITSLTPDRLIVPTGADGPEPSNELLLRLRRLRRPTDADERADVLDELAENLPAESRAASSVRWLRHLFDDNTIPAAWITALLAHLIGDDAAGNPSAAVTPATELATSILRLQIALLTLDVPAEETLGRILSAGQVVVNALRFAGDKANAAEIDRARTEAASAVNNAPLLSALGALATRLATPPQAVSHPSSGTPRAPAEDAVERSAPRILRVDQEKVDALMNLVGELVVAKNSLPFLARRAEHHFGIRELGREIKDQYGVIDRIAQELQAAIMGVRMMPVGQVFQRFPRLVRDISRKLGKQVELVIEGETTEADKNVIENLFDPLLHMVRNSLDHGIENPEQRAASGKPASATIRLSARQESDQVLIVVADDGRGIDPEVIKHKAFERGLIDASRLASITDDEARRLIFAAGFSTAETVSDLSGRGVGMDVVRNAVEKAGGRISVASQVGRGTTVELSVPLSMAVTRVMTVLNGDRLFGIAMDVIVETVKLKRHEIVAIKDRSAFVLRDRIVPLVPLSELLDLPDAMQFGEEVAILVVRVSGHTLGLAISAFGEGMEVILKPLDGILTGINGYAGTSLLGDGRVLLVLNLAELVP